VNFDESEFDKKKEKKLKEMYKPLTDWWKDLLGFSKVMKVEISKRLVEDPVAVVSSQYGSSAYMEKIVKAQTFADPMQLRMMSGSKTLEINPSHPIIKDLLAKIKENKDDPGAKHAAETLFTAGLLASGFDVDNPTDIASALYKVISSDLGVDPAASVQEIEVEVDMTEEDTQVKQQEDFELGGEDQLEVDDLHGSEEGSTTDQDEKLSKDKKNDKNESKNDDEKPPSSDNENIIKDEL